MKPKNSSGYRIGIVNPLTLVGNEIKTILTERSFPLAKLVLLDTTGEAAGALTEVGDEPAVVAPVSAIELEALDLVFFCGPPEPNREWIERNTTDGFIVIDLSQPSTIEEGALAIAGMNLDEFADETVFISPHPVTIPIALILHQIEGVSGIELCTATVIQPASELGQAGVDELAAQTVSALNIQPVPRKVFNRQSAFNLYPAAEHNEEFIVKQVRRLIEPETDVALLITQGTIFHSHTFSLFVRMEEAMVSQTVINALKANKAIAFPEGDQAFSTTDAAGRDEVLIAEVRADPSIEGGCWVWAVCDNLRRSAALNAVLIAEKVLFGRVIN
ncbi:MAG: Asd/ArgC dimerization domain-containing protein [Thermoanaerobaculia bacterium]